MLANVGPQLAQLTLSTEIHGSFKTALAWPSSPGGVRLQIDDLLVCLPQLWQGTEVKTFLNRHPPSFMALSKNHLLLIRHKKL